MSSQSSLPKIGFPWRIFLRSVVLQAFLVVLAIGLAGLTARYFFKKEFLNQVSGQLKDTLISLQRNLPPQTSELPADWCSRFAKGTANRLTIIARDGKVLCDSRHDPLGMENHRSRPEVIDALNGTFGQVIRWSTTVEEDMLYGAIPSVPGVTDGLILRGAIPLATLSASLNFFDRFLVLVLVLIAAGFGGLTIWSGRILVAPLSAAQQIRIDFVANVSHELRTPLTSIKGYTDTLIGDVEQGRPVEKSFLEVIARNVTRLMELIGDLLDLSALESADILQKGSVKTEEVTARVIQQMKPGFDSKKQIIESDFSALTVFGDSKRIEQVLINLLDNAHKYTPASGKIGVSWQREGRDVVLRVRDNGPGIPPEHHARLFERFYRVDKARSREQGGTGLGLAIVKHIMQKHDGSVSVESRAGHGSVFICRFPA